MVRVSWRWSDLLQIDFSRDCDYERLLSVNGAPAMSGCYSFGTSHFQSGLHPSPSADGTEVHNLYARGSFNWASCPSSRPPVRELTPLALAGAADVIAAAARQAADGGLSFEVTMRCDDKGPGLLLRRLRACESNRARGAVRLARLQSGLLRGTGASRSGRALSSVISPSGVAGIRSGAWP